MLTGTFWIRFATDGIFRARCFRSGCCRRAGRKRTRNWLRIRRIGPAVVQSLRHEIEGLKPEGGKISRAAAASPQLEAGNWYLPHPMIAPWVEKFIAECSAFPAGANDDQVDA